MREPWRGAVHIPPHTFALPVTCSESSPSKLHSCKDRDMAFSHEGGNWHAGNARDGSGTHNGVCGKAAPAGVHSGLQLVQFAVHVAAVVRNMTRYHTLLGAFHRQGILEAPALCAGARQLANGARPRESAMRQGIRQSMHCQASELQIEKLPCGHGVIAARSSRGLCPCQVGIMLCITPSHLLCFGSREAQPRNGRVTHLSFAP